MISSPFGRRGSLSAAAKRRRVAISTISRRIESLENALKLRLVDRQAKGTTLTYFGELIAKTAEPIAEQLARVNRLADGLRSEGGNLPVRLSATEFVISDVLAPALPALWTQGVDFPVHLQSQGRCCQPRGARCRHRCPDVPARRGKFDNAQTASAASRLFCGARISGQKTTVRHRFSTRTLAHL